MKNIRLKDYDYSRNGAYFITICVRDKHELLCTIVGAGSTRPCTELTDYGIIVKENIETVNVKYPNICVSKYVIMPNHMHLIINVAAAPDGRVPGDGRVDPAPTANGRVYRDGRVDPAPTIGRVLGDGRVDPAPTLGQIIGYFKYKTTKEIGISGFWQRSYHDHIIRDEGEYRKIAQYIDINPTKWTEDRYYIHE